MKFVTAAWISSLELFERNVGLSEHVRNAKFSSEHPLHVCILKGLEYITDEYRHLLASGFIELIDCTHIVNALYSQDLLADGLKYVNEYEAFCFLRWLVFGEVFCGEPFVHLDTDLFLNPKASEVAAMVTGLTGTFGSPCFAVVSDYSWIHQYEHYLKIFLADRGTFEAKFLQKNQLSLRDHIGSDQDFVTILDAHQILPRTLGVGVSDESVKAFVNPLWPYRSKPDSPLIFEENRQYATINGVPVLFWHMQNAFCRYLARYFFIHDMLSDQELVHEAFVNLVIPNPYSKLFPSPAAFPFAAIDKFFRLLSLENSSASSALNLSLDAMHAHPIKDYNPYVRKYIYRRFLSSSESKRIFSPDYWWEEGVWGKPV